MQVYGIPDERRCSSASTIIDSPGCSTKLHLQPGYLMDSDAEMPRLVLPRFEKYIGCEMPDGYFDNHDDQAGQALADKDG